MLAFFSLSLVAEKRKTINVSINWTNARKNGKAIPTLKLVGFINEKNAVQLILRSHSYVTNS